MRFSVKAMRAGEGLTALSFDAANPVDATRQAELQGYTDGIVVLMYMPIFDLAGSIQ
ncbi:predicted secretion system X protein GspF-like [Sulfuriferula multivorans]|uniref:Predicted secretion system X protein GspF-like n=1 Tax=Sulfuriferula multivorans TaxID=1559896 RepID=A0A401JI02_9PROT|nr:hypothetical protein [Sulfuriferula multivorans]GBL47720.1 predicted secretion system X protein GspF-like [Sulfuriferula multivorans]